MGLRRAAAQPRLGLGVSPPPAQAGSARGWENTRKDLGMLNEAYRHTQGAVLEKTSGFAGGL